MRRIAACLLCIFLLCGTASAETVSFGAVSFDTDTEYIDMGDEVVTDYNRFIAFLRQFPNLKKVDMFSTPIPADKVQKLEKAFPDVSFGWYLKMMRYHFIRSDAEAYSTLHGVHPNHPSREFVLLKYCTRLKALDLAPIRESAAMLLEGRTDYEFRTTTVAEFHDDRSFEEIGKWIRGAKRYYLQRFTDRETVPFEGLHAPTEEICGHNDHRIVMAMTALLSTLGGTIEGAEAVTKSYPDFFERIKEIGIEVKKDGLDL